MLCVPLVLAMDDDGMRQAAVVWLFKVHDDDDEDDEDDVVEATTGGWSIVLKMDLWDEVKAWGWRAVAQDLNERGGGQGGYISFRREEGERRYRQNMYERQKIKGAMRRVESTTLAPRQDTETETGRAAEQKRDIGEEWDHHGEAKAMGRGQ